MKKRPRLAGADRHGRKARRIVARRSRKDGRPASSRPGRGPLKRGLVTRIWKTIPFYVWRCPNDRKVIRNGVKHFVEYQAKLHLEADKKKQEQREYRKDVTVPTLAQAEKRQLAKIQVPAQ